MSIFVTINAISGLCLFYQGFSRLLKAIGHNLLVLRESTGIFFVLGFFSGCSEEIRGMARDGIEPPTQRFSVSRYTD